MRQTKATWAIIGVSVVLVGVLIAFGCERSAGDPEDAMEGAEHMVEGEHHHDGPAEEHGEHMEGPAHEHEHEAVAGEETTPPGPSGKIVDGVRVVKVVARRFEFDPSTIVVRQGEKVRLEVTSDDVTHGIGIEAYDIDETLLPGETKRVEFTADKPGRHHFHCSVYCGGGHNDMHGELMVLEHTD